PIARVAATGPGGPLLPRGRVPQADAVGTHRGNAAAVRREGDGVDAVGVAVDFLAKCAAGGVPQLDAIAAVGGQRAAVAVKTEGKYFALVAGQRARRRLFQVPHETGGGGVSNQPAAIGRE